jgi:hypothetical protein
MRQIDHGRDPVFERHARLQFGAKKPHGDYSNHRRTWINHSGNGWSFVSGRKGSTAIPTSSTQLTQGWG